MKRIKIIILFICSFFTAIISAEELGQLSTEQLIAMQKQDNALVIDIRTEKEWNTTGIIPESHKLQFFTATGKYDPDKWLSDLNQLKSTPDQAVILVCRSGSRSGMVGNMLAKKMGMKNVHHLSTGIMPWIKAGNKTTTDCSSKLACK
jgi:rhodanese-related sulfurtransferase